MSFTLPWIVNKLVSTNINNSNSITGTYSNTCSLKVNGNTELDSDTIIAHLGVNKQPSATYALDVNGGVNATSLSIGGTTVPFNDFVKANQTNSFTNPNFFANDVDFQSGGSVMFNGDVEFANGAFPAQFFIPPVYSGYSWSPAANEFMTREWSDDRYGELATTNSWTGSNSFSTLPTSSGSVTASNELITKAYADATYTGTGLLSANNTWSGLNTFTGGITASGTQTINFGTNAPTMSGSNIGSSTIPTNAISDYGVGFGRLVIPNTWTNTNTFSGGLTTTGGITASATQTINFGTNAPTMWGTNITAIPDGALSSNITRLNTAQTFTGLKTFTNGINATSTQTINFGLNSPLMWGQGIAAGTINDGSLTGNVPLKNGTNIFTGANTFSNLTFSNVSSSITLTNPAFQLPLKSAGSNFTALVSSSSTTYAPNATFLTAQGFTGWGFSGTSYTAGIQEGVFGTYFMTYYPIGNQCLILASNGNNMNMKSENYTLAKGEYVFSFQLQTQYMEANASITASVVLGSTTIESSPPLNVRGYYPDWTTYQFGFVVPTSGSYYFNFAFVSSTGSDYVAISGTTLALVNAMLISDGTNTSAIGGSQSVLNSLFVRNSLTVESGGMNVEGSVNLGTAYGSNNIAINSPIGSEAGTSNSAVIAIGAGALQYGTSLSKFIAIGNSLGVSSATTASNMVVVGGNSQNESNSTIIGYNVVSSAPTGYNAIVGSQIGSGVGDYNSVLGCNIFKSYNGYGSLFPNYNCAIGYNSQNLSADSYNVSVGANSLSLIDGLTLGIGYNTRYNTAIGNGTGSSQARMNYCTFLGAGADVNTGNLSYATAIGAGAIATTSNGIYLGRSSDTTYCVGGLNIPSGEVFTLLGTITANSLSVTPTQLGFLNYLKLTGGNQGWGGNSLNLVSTASDCVAFGPNTLTQVTSSGQNTAFGSNAGWGVTGVSNTCIGCFANGGTSPVSCSDNTAIGNQALVYATGNQNTACGSNAGSGLVGGANNVMIGYNSSATYEHNNCTLVGAATDLNATGYTNSTALGYGAIITGSNRIILGTAADTTYAMGGLNIPSGEVLTLLGSITANSLSVSATQVGYLQGVSTGIVDTASTQNIGGTKTFTGLVAAGSQYIHEAYTTPLTAATNIGTLTTALYEYYSINAPSATGYTITLPGITTSNLGAKVVFRRVGGNTTAPIAFIGNGTQLVYNTALTGGATAQTLMPNAVYIVRLVPMVVTGTTYAWFQI